MVRFATRRESLPAYVGSRTAGQTSGYQGDGWSTTEMESRYPEVMDNWIPVETTFAT